MNPFDNYGVVIAQAKNEGEARELVQAALPGNVHVTVEAWKKPRKGSATMSAARVIRSHRDKDVCLLIPGADALNRNPGDDLPEAIAEHFADKDAASWIVLVSFGGELDALLKGIDVAPSDLLLKTAEETAPMRRSTQGTTTGADFDDILDLGRFDKEAWTRNLSNLSAQEVAKICSNSQYVDACVGRVNRLIAQLDQKFVGKTELIRLMCECSIGQLPMLLLGTWGTGKSMVVRLMSQCLGIRSEQRSIDEEDSLLADLNKAAKAGDVSSASVDELLQGNSTSRYFEYLVTRFTTPEELLGPVNVEALLSFAVHLRQTRSLLPRAEIVFLDEVFKANSSILNALLSIMNERLFYNAGSPWSVNMIMLFGASNEPPMEEDLGAFYDRFPVRALSDPVSPERLRDLLLCAHSQTCLSTLKAHQKTGDEDNATGGMFLDPSLSGDAQKAARDDAKKLLAAPIEQVACVNDFRLLRMACLYRFGGPYIDGANSNFTSQYLRVFRLLRNEYDISDRSCAHFYRLARSRALLDRNRPVNEMKNEDLHVLRYCGKTVDELRQLGSIVEALI